MRIAMALGALALSLGMIVGAQAAPATTTDSSDGRIVVAQMMNGSSGMRRPMMSRQKMGKRSMMKSRMGRKPMMMKRKPMMRSKRMM